MSVSISFYLLEKLQEHLELCPPQDHSCSGAALQPWALMLLERAVCMLWWLACSPLSVLHRRGRLLFPLSPRIHNSPCDFTRSSFFLVSSGLCSSASESSWGMGALEGNEGPAGWEICGVGSTFPNASVLGSFWEWTTHVLVSRPPQRSRQSAAHGHGDSGGQVVPWALLSFQQHPGICEKAACFSHVSEGLAEFLGCFPRLPASSSHEMSAGNELQECSCTCLQHCAAIATSAKP